MSVWGSVLRVCTLGKGPGLQATGSWLVFTETFGFTVIFQGPSPCSI